MNTLDKRIEEYCEKNTYHFKSLSKMNIYVGRLKEEYKSLSDYEITILMAGRDVISYDVDRKENGYFRVMIYD